QNWGELAGIEPLPREARHWVKELQSVRNRWAHAPAEGFSQDDAFRDADTLSRLLQVIDADASILSRIAEFKEAILPRRGHPSPTSLPALESVAAPMTPSASRFAVGQLLCLKSNPSAVFPVLEILPGAGTETRYRVFEGGARQVYYESQLQALDEQQDSFKVLSASELSAMLSAVQLSSPSASALYSLNSGRVRFVPYQ